MGLQIALTKTHRSWGATMRAAAEEIKYVVPECATNSDGCGPIFELSSSERGRLLVLTLAMNRILEDETLFVSIWGSPDAENWGTAPIVSFPPKHCCGLYSILLNLATHSEIRYIRARWRMQPWKNTTKQMMFGFYISIEPSGSRISAGSVYSLSSRKRLIKAAG